MGSTGCKKGLVGDLRGEGGFASCVLAVGAVAGALAGCVWPAVAPPFPLKKEEPPDPPKKDPPGLTAGTVVVVLPPPKSEGTVAAGAGTVGCAAGCPVVCSGVTAAVFAGAEGWADGSPEEVAACDPENNPLMELVAPVVAAAFIEKNPPFTSAAGCGKAASLGTSAADFTGSGFLGTSGC